MLTVHNEKKRFRCDRCKKLIPAKNEGRMVTVGGYLYSAFEDRDYHFCNTAQWEKTFTEAYQLKLDI